MKPVFKKILPYVAASVIFVVLTLVYCSPVLEGKVLQSGDILSWKGAYQEAKTYHEQTGRYTFWTGSMFCGMPNYQIGGGRYGSQTVLMPLSKLIRFGGLKDETLLMILGYFFCFYILMRAFRVNPWLSIVGAVAVALSSYFFIIIGAGHNSKAMGLAWMSAVLAGFVLIYRKRYAWGIIITMVFSYMGLMKHPQMSYYLFMLLGLLFLAELYSHIREKRMKDFGLATLMFALALLVGAGTQYSAFASNNDYVRETMRGGHSELAKATDAQNKTVGLDLDYATAWSYGIDETFTLIMPNFKGASSGFNVGTDSKLYKTMVSKGVPKKSAASFCEQVPSYWGTQPFTSGPVYVGAVVCFLFLLGLFIVRGPYKWALLAATVFSILLSWGKNFMPFTRFFFDCFPMYNKFRTVSSILVVAEITMPLLGMLSLKAIMEKALSKRWLLISLYLSAGITAVLCLVFALFGKSMFDFSAPADAQMFSQLPQWLSQAIVDQRAAMLTADAWRSFVFIALAALVVWLCVQDKLKAGWATALIGVLVLADMWPVDKRFLNDNDFVAPRQYNSYFAKRPYEEQILRDTDPHFRVFNLAANTFNDSRTSYYLKSLGGYHAAKLRRYQDLIDQHFAKMNGEVVNMLNAKYIIYKDNENQVRVQQNAEAYGNAWFVDSLVIAQTPNEECDALNHLNLRTTAVTDAKFEPFVQAARANGPADSDRQVALTSYAPDVLTYTCQSSQPATLVFSEIYYPYGWKAYIDGQPCEHFRADYTLRAMNVPAGRHDIRFEFRPDTVYRGGIVSVASAVLIYLTIAGGLVQALVGYRRRKEASGE